MNFNVTYDEIHTSHRDKNLKNRAASNEDTLKKPMKYL